MAFELIAGHPALDFVNTLDWRFGGKSPEELLKSYGHLLEFAEQSKVLTAVQARRLERAGAASSGAQALASCREFREALAEVFYAGLDARSPSAAARETLERYIQAARGRQKLNWRQSPRLEWEWPDSDRDARLPLWALAIGASELMTSETVDRLRACDNPECRWLFLDTSKNHTKRWCDMRLCGNRMKARRFKAQHKA
jgi:predicted RNA-binding Zn ribbon-like protein